MRRFYLIFAALLVGGTAIATAFWYETRPVRLTLKSPFPSSVPGISIPNTHVVTEKKGKLLRGMAPLQTSDIKDLADYGVNEVLIFRNDSEGESFIAEELKMIASEPRIHAVHAIPFRWKDVVDFRGACEQTIRALRILATAAGTQGATLFFHCTVGEDRTGYLTGLYRVVFEDADPQHAFHNEMCARGYAEGDPKKPAHVAEKVRENLTPLFVKMLNLIASGKVSANQLDIHVCDVEPTIDVAKVSLDYKCSINE